jgi:hypothetical protein
MRRLVLWHEDKQHRLACEALTTTIVWANVEWIAAGGYSRTSFTELVDRWESPPPRSSKRHKPEFGRGLVRTVLHRLLIDCVEAGLSEEDVVVFAHDLDRRPEVGSDVAAVFDGRWPFGTIAMLPNPEIEAWQILLATIREERLVATTHRLGFSPIDEPTRLSSTTNEAGRDCKAVRDELGLEEWSAEDWSDVSLQRIESIAASRGVGLAEFVTAVKAELVERLTPKESPSR